MKSSLLNMVLSLFGITLVCALLVGGAHLITKEPIEQARNRNQRGALLSVLPRFDNDPTRERRLVKHDGAEAIVYFARMHGDIVGIAVETSAPGYSGAVRVMVGFEMSGMITNIVVTEQTETPGLGDVIASPESIVKTSIVGRNASEIRLSLRKDGGDVDGITAATVSSRAYVNAVRRAYEVFRLATTQSPDALDELFSGDEAAVGIGTQTEPDATTGATHRTDSNSGATVQADDGVPTMKTDTDTDSSTGATKKDTSTDSESDATKKRKERDDEKD